MSFLAFKDLFPNFANLSEDQEYDENKKSACSIVKGFSTYYLEQINESESDLKKPSKVTTDIKILLNDIDSAIEVAITEIMPPESATANADYVIEETGLTTVSIVTPIEHLRSVGRGNSESNRGFRIANATLEQSFQVLLDHLTSRRVAEEMDAPTYLERLRGTFRRAADGARTQGSKFDNHAALANRLTNRLSILEKVFDFLRKNALPKLAEKSQEQKLDTADIEEKLSTVEGFYRSAKEYTKHFKKFSDLSRRSMERVHQEFASDMNEAGAEAEAKQVSRQIERLAFYRPLPFLWALLITVLVKVVLAHNSSEFLHILAIQLMVTTFILVWGMSIFFGVWARKRRMIDLRNHIHAQLRNVLMIQDMDADLFEFPTIKSDFNAPKEVPVKAYNVSDRKIRETTIARWNLLAFLIPVVLALVVWIARNEDGYDFVARYPGLDACILASGRMVFATQDAYFVMPDDRVNGFPRLVLSQIFPEILADPIERDFVIRVRSRADDNRLKLTNCTALDPKKDALRIIHEGIAFGPIERQETDGMLTGQTTALNTAISAPHPLNPDLTETDDDDRVKSTDNPGDTSLDVLAQAISGGQGEYGLAPPIRTLVLPFWPNPVTSETGLLDPQSVFEWGSDPDNLVDPEIADNGGTYLGRVAETLQSCIASNGKVELDVLGLASRSWKYAPDAATTEQLNYYLAEARRVAILRKFSELMENDDFGDHILVKLTDGTTITMSEIIARSQQTGNIENNLPSFARFDNARDFESRRATLFSVTGLIRETASPLEELFARSVVLKVIGIESGPCVF